MHRSNELQHLRLNKPSLFTDSDTNNFLFSSVVWSDLDPSIALTGNPTRKPWTSNLASSPHAKMSEQAKLVKQARYDHANILSFVLHFAAFLHIHLVSNA